MSRVFRRPSHSLRQVLPSCRKGAFSGELHGPARTSAACEPRCGWLKDDDRRVRVWGVDPAVL